MSQRRRANIKSIREVGKSSARTDVPVMDRSKMYAEFRREHPDLEVNKVNSLRFTKNVGEDQPLLGFQ